MATIARVVILSAAILATACSLPPRYQYFRDGATAEQFAADELYCYERTKSIQPEAGFGDFSIFDVKNRQSEIFNTCMRSRGYRVEAIE